MQLTFVLAALVSLVAANGSIQLCSGNNGAGTCESGTYTPPKNCNGGCVKVTDKSAKQLSADNGFCFTVYSDGNCSNDKRKVPSSWINGNFKSFSYDCC